VPARFLRRALGLTAAAAALALVPAATAAPRIAIERTTGFDSGAIQTNVFTLRPDGNGLFQVTHEPSPRAAELPDWAPNRKRIVYMSNRGGPTRLWTIGADGKHLRRLTDGDRFDTDPSWSPSGKQIAFARPTRPDSDTGSVFDVFTVHPDGTGLRRLTKGSSDAQAPSWSPDGKRLVFRRTKPGGHPQAWTMRPDGTHLRKVTHLEHGINEPAWSPNGKLIAFSSPIGFGIEIFVVPAKGGSVRQVTSDGNGTTNAEPTWSPDSKRIVFKSSHSPPSGAHIDSITPKGKGRRVVIGDPSGQTVYAAPSWAG
jgi:Tol biopolymer transport system component